MNPTLADRLIDDGDEIASAISFRRDYVLVFTRKGHIYRLDFTKPFGAAVEISVVQ